jgi:ABC-type transporter Mla subunit MlaD
MPETPSEAFERGAKAGEIQARLAGHDTHFASINGSLGQIVGELRSLNLAVQHLSDQASANAATVITTAAALKDAEDARRDQSVQTWTPWARTLALLGGLVAIMAIIADIVLYVRH